MADRPVIVLFYRDLRTEDHPALLAASETGAPVIPLFVLDEEAAGRWAPGGASRWWLHHALASLARDLEAIGGRLVLRRGDTLSVLADVIAASNAASVYFTRNYEPWVSELESRIHAQCAEAGVEVKRFRGRLLCDPDSIRTKAGDVYKVYTPFMRAVMEHGVRRPVARPKQLGQPAKGLASDRLADWGLLPERPNWASEFSGHWRPGASEALARFEQFVDERIGAYDADRNRPDIAGTSRLSPHLHFGEISVAACWHRLLPLLAESKSQSKGVETYLKELVWREFSYHLLVHFPTLPLAPFQPRFEAFPWRDDELALVAWQTGQTGVPIVDAGMRELWSTGWMHNRVRMIVGSFLTKNLLIPWQRGEAWFWDCLVDADLASNAASWQWVAGSGADAAPYFRIFNPVTQSQKFDPDGDYIRRWVPELAGLGGTAIHAPWLVDAEVLGGANVRLGESYPQPLVDLGNTRTRALEAYNAIKS